MVRILLFTGILSVFFSCATDKGNGSFGRNSYRLELSAEALFMRSTSQGTMLTENGITLEDQLLIEDDAPAFGYSSMEGSAEILKKGIVIKKVLKIGEQPVGPAKIVMLVYPDFPPQPNNGHHLIFSINGNEIKYEVKHFWTDVPVPVSYLHEGDNVITVRVLEPDSRFKTFIALDENYRIGSSDRLVHPNRSARSTDDGLTWDFDHLGEKGVVDGEYPIRLKLSNYHSSGWLQSPIIDMAANSNIDGIMQPVVIEKANIALHKEFPENTQIEIEARTGTSHFISDTNWTDWKTCTNGEIPESLLKERHLQFRVAFTSNSPAASPLLEKVEIDCQYSISDRSISEGISVVELINKPKRSSSFDFEYEHPQHPELKELRKRYGLDEVVKGYTSEFEKMLKLMNWVASQWHWHLLEPNEKMVAWDALDILKTDENGEIAGGYCLHYAIVCMQALQSFGFHSRIVNANYAVWGGHELTEVWSNEFGKWILLDPNFDTYFADKETGIPLNALELHQLFLEEYYPGEAIDRDNWSREDFVNRVESKRVPQSIVCMVGGGAQGGTLTEYEWYKPVAELFPYCGGYGFLSTGYFRLLPRNNFLSKPSPMPVNHGRTVHWGWTGYYSWYDHQTPRAQEFAQFTNRPNDLYWNLNEVDFSASLKARDKLLITWTTNSPNFDRYELNINGTVKTLKENHYLLDLVPGRNHLKIQVVDGMNNRGPESILEVFNSKTKSNPAIEFVTTTECWVSPCWGYNASKIVRNSKDELWAINMFGSYPSASAQIYKRKNRGNWEAGRKFEGIYQPGMIFLDHKEHLNVIVNSETEPVKHFRSIDEKNLNNFKLIASGNGQQDGRGWYVGAGVYEKRIFMAYITLDYDLWLTWKNINDSTWHPAILVYDGFPSPEGNHALTYPKFQFNNDTGYIMTSHTSDGGVHNTYDKVFLTSFPVMNPEKLSSEIIYEGDLGYYTHGYDMMLGKEGTMYCAYGAGEHKYGQIKEGALSSGLYVSVKHPHGSEWQQYQIHDKAGNVALHISDVGELFAIITEGEWSSENRTLLKKSNDYGSTWTTYDNNLLNSMPDIKHQFFLQTVQENSGSSVNGIQALFSNVYEAKTADSLYKLDLGFLQFNTK
ncbi:MAG: transglutaminase domain-containing protein [Bacteroidota bacterium]